MKFLEPYVDSPFFWMILVIIAVVLVVLIVKLIINFFGFLADKLPPLLVGILFGGITGYSIYQICWGIYRVKLQMDGIDGTDIPYEKRRMAAAVIFAVMFFIFYILKKTESRNFKLQSTIDPSSSSLDSDTSYYDYKVTALVSFLVTKVNEIRSIGRVLQVNCYPDKIVIEYSTDDSGEKAKCVYFDKKYCDLDINSLRQYFVYLNEEFSMEKGCYRYRIPDVFTYPEWNKMFDEWQNRLMRQYSVSGLLIGRFSIHE